MSRRIYFLSYRATVAFLALVILGLSPTWRANAGACQDAREVIQADPAWQQGSVPAQLRAFIGSGVVEKSANAWVQGLDLPVLQGFAAALHPRVENLRFHADSDRSPLVIAFEIKLGADSGGVPSRIPGLGSTNVSLNSSVPVVLDQRGEDVVLVAQMRDADFSISTGAPRMGNILNQIKRFLLNESSFIVARFEPIPFKELRTSVQPIDIQFVSETLISVDMILPEVAASMNQGNPIVPDDATLDDIVISMSQEAALAIGDYGLRVLGRRGYGKSGKPPGAFYLRLLRADMTPDAFNIRIQGIRYKRICAITEVDAHIQVETRKNSGQQLSVRDTQIMRSTTGRMITKLFLPSSKNLGRTATNLLEHIIEETRIELPLLPGTYLQLERIHISQGVLYAYAGLHTQNHDLHGAQP